MIGVLYIDWGLGTRSWVQRADKQNKVIIESRRDLKEQNFPGYDAGEMGSVLNQEGLETALEEVPVPSAKTVVPGGEGRL